MYILLYYDVLLFVVNRRYFSYYLYLSIVHDAESLTQLRTVNFQLNRRVIIIIKCLPVYVTRTLYYYILILGM